MANRVKGDEIRLVEWFLETVINLVFGTLFYTVLDFHARRTTGISFAELILEKPRKAIDILFVASNKDVYTIKILERLLEGHIRRVLKRPVGEELFEAIRNDDAKKVKQILIGLAREYMAKVERG